MDFNIKLNALLWEICKLGSAAAACTSWNSEHSVDINRQQVIYLGITGADIWCHKQYLNRSCLPCWGLKNTTAWWWQFLPQWAPRVPQARAPRAEFIHLLAELLPPWVLQDCQSMKAGLDLSPFNREPPGAPQCLGALPGIGGSPRDTSCAVGSETCWECHEKYCAK